MKTFSPLTKQNQDEQSYYYGHVQGSFLLRQTSNPTTTVYLVRFGSARSDVSKIARNVQELAGGRS